MTKKFKIRLLFLIPMLVAIILAFSLLPGGNEPPPDKIGETITITATVDTQIHYSRTVSEVISISAEK